MKKEAPFNPAWETLKIYLTEQDFDGNEIQPAVAFVARGRKGGRPYIVAQLFPIDFADRSGLTDPDGVADIVARLDVMFRIAQ
jgi:hypothetical protein